MNSRKIIWVIAGILIAALIVGFSYKTIKSGNAYFKNSSKKENRG
jgi:hypothetical protein